MLYACHAAKARPTAGICVSQNVTARVAKSEQMSRPPRRLFASGSRLTRDGLIPVASQYLPPSQRPPPRLRAGGKSSGDSEAGAGSRMHPVRSAYPSPNVPRRRRWLQTTVAGFDSSGIRQSNDCAPGADTKAAVDAFRSPGRSRQALRGWRRPSRWPPQHGYADSSPRES